jgi:hypothetical protein
VTAADAEEIDFKPFFDMVVGILFILLILISAQIFFAQHVVDDASQEAERRALERERQSTAFLEDLATRLRGDGFDARVDRHRRAVALSTTPLMSATPAGTPQFAEGASVTLGKILSERLPCVAATSPARTTCPDTDLLKLGSLEAELRLTALPERTPVPQERYAQLATTLFSAALLRAQPDLLAFTNAGGVPALRFSGMNQPDAPQASLAGALNLIFVFQP